MGNCINAASRDQQRRHERVMPEEEGDHGVGSKRCEEEEEEEAAAAAAGLKVKVVLTRAELEWLMAQIKAGDRRLEDVLHQMGAARAAADEPPPPRDGWRPGLDCILECHEDPAGL